MPVGNQATKCLSPIFTGLWNFVVAVWHFYMSIYYFTLFILSYFRTFFALREGSPKQFPRSCICNDNKGYLIRFEDVPLRLHCGAAVSFCSFCTNIFALDCGNFSSVRESGNTIIGCGTNVGCWGVFSLLKLYLLLRHHFEHFSASLALRVSSFIFNFFFFCS